MAHEEDKGYQKQIHKCGSEEGQQIEQNVNQITNQQKGELY